MREPCRGAMRRVRRAPADKRISGRGIMRSTGSPTTPVRLVLGVPNAWEADMAALGHTSILGRLFAGSLVLPTTSQLTTPCLGHGRSVAGIAPLRRMLEATCQLGRTILGRSSASKEAPPTLAAGVRSNIASHSRRILTVCPRAPRKAFAGESGLVANAELGPQRVLAARRGARFAASANVEPLATRSGRNGLAVSRNELAAPIGATSKASHCGIAVR